MTKYTVSPKTNKFANVEEPIVLSESSTTRLIFQAGINNSNIMSGQTVGGEILHQRKGPNDEWEDIESIDKRKLRSGEGVKIHFHSNELKTLFESLSELYQLGEYGVPQRKKEMIVGYADQIIEIPEDRKSFIQKLLSEDYGEEIWAELIDNDPDLATRLSMAKLQQNRIIALKEFEGSINDETLSELHWQNFFSNNKWIFGYGLNYVFLSELKEQPNYGGGDYTAKGNQKGDFLLNSNATSKFTVLVEIKKPSTRLLLQNTKNKNYQYRNNIFIPDYELSGGVSQIQSNCEMWGHVARDYNNKKLEQKGIYTFQPKGILIIGNLVQFQSDEERKSFELYRRNIYNPQIITFDELLERAKFIVQNEETNLEESDLDIL
ncbi:MAG: Shedu immune nuclease family protein [bacterium]